MLRKLRVYKTGDAYRGTEQPQVKLQGQWLRQAGFEPGDRITVTKEGSRLIIERCDAQ